MIAAVKLHTNAKPVAATFSDLSPDQPEVHAQSSLSSEECDPGYLPYIHEGYVSLPGSEKKVSAKILRDTGALESYIIEYVLPFS